MRIVLDDDIVSVATAGHFWQGTREAFDALTFQAARAVLIDFYGRVDWRVDAVGWRAQARAKAAATADYNRLDEDAQHLVMRIVAADIQGRQQ